MRADEINDRDQAILRALMSDGRLTNLALACSRRAVSSPATSCRSIPTSQDFLARRSFP
jgi:hypothetical protein